MKRQSEDFQYLDGFGNSFTSEALKGALPAVHNSPQKPPFGLYAEQFSGTTFTARRDDNYRTWFYRIRPSVLHSNYELLSSPHLQLPDPNTPSPPNQMRWDPFEYPKEETDFVSGLQTLAATGQPESHAGCAIHVYAANRSMTNRYFSNSDGHLLIVPQEGELLFKTELGRLKIKPSEIAVIPRGMRFQVELLGPHARGYVCENFGGHFVLPDLGLIGANGLANPRDFLTPSAWYEEKSGNLKLVNKYLGNLWEAKIEHSPLDVVAWHGNEVPYKYDLTSFNTINTVSFDHPDPSIFTVLRSRSEIECLGNIDFVIFPPMWHVAQDTFRPPYYHRNVMSEYMGLIHGTYVAKEKGFVPGGSSLHNCMAPHGPEKDVFETATQTPLDPTYRDNTLAFMFESRFPLKPTRLALETKARQKDYLQCWKGLKSHFSEKTEV